MNTDIRLKISFFDNIKILKLYRRCGADGVLALIRLWCYVAANKPDGKLTDMDAEDISLVACWAHADSMLTVCEELRLIEKKGKVYVIHDWEDNNPWAASADKRSEQARDAAKARWGKTKEKQEVSPNAASMRSACVAHANSNAPYLTLPTITLPQEYEGSKEFAECWLEWEKYRRQKKQTLTEATIKKQIKMLTALPVETAIAVIDMSIRNGWTGLFPEKVGQKGSTVDDKIRLPWMYGG